MITHKISSIYSIQLEAAAAMHRIAVLAANENTRYAHGRCRLKSGPKLVEEFNDKYKILEPKATRSRRRKKGIAVTRLVTLLRRKTIHWWFVVSDTGTIKTPKNMRLLSMGNKKETLEYNGYELVTRKKWGREKPTWTWRMTDKLWNGWNEKIESAAKSGRPNASLEALAQKLLALPRFHGVRRQAIKLHRAMEKRGEISFNETWLYRLADEKPLNSGSIADIRGLIKMESEKRAGH